jgi:hypothetical protein
MILINILFIGSFLQILITVSCTSSLFVDKLSTSNNYYNYNDFVIKLFHNIKDHSIFQQILSTYYHYTTNSKNSTTTRMKYEIYNLDKLINKCKTYLEYPSSSYEYLGKDDKDEIMVWKLKNKFIISDNTDAERYPIVKSKIIIKTSIENMLSLLLNSENVKLTNSYSLGRDDVEIISRNKKIVYNRSKIPILLQIHDYVTIMHWLQDTRNDYMILSKGITHEKCPLNKEYTRSEIILGLNYLRKISKDTTELTTINHIKYNNIHPFLINRNVLSPTIEYLQKLKKLALQN